MKYCLIFPFLLFAGCTITGSNIPPELIVHSRESANMAKLTSTGVDAFVDAAVQAAGDPEDAKTLRDVGKVLKENAAMSYRMARNNNEAITKLGTK